MTTPNSMSRRSVKSSPRTSSWERATPKGEPALRWEDLARPLIVCVAAALYLLAIMVVHSRFIAPTFTYLGYGYRTVPFEWMCVAVTLAALAAPALPRRIERPSQFASTVVFILVIVPSIAMGFALGRLEYTDAAVHGALMVGAYWLLALTVRGFSPGRDGTLRAGRRGRRLNGPIVILPKATETGAVVVLLAIFLLGHAYLALTLGLSFDFVALVDVYDVRQEYSGDVSGAPFAAYLVPWLGNAIGPIIAVYGAYRRHWWLVGLAAMGQLALYAQTGLKTLLFSLPALAVVALLLTMSRRAHRLVLAALAGIVLIAVIDEAVGDGLLTSLFVRRFVVTPGVLSSMYYEFFSERPFTYLSQSVLEGVTTYPFANPVPIEVGSYWTSYAPSANANFLADGFANFGAVGLLLFALLTGLLLRLYDVLADGLPVIATSLLLVMPLVTLSNSGLLTSLMTHGVGLVLLMVGVLPRAGWGRPARNPARTALADSLPERADEADGDVSAGDEVGETLRTTSLPGSLRPRVNARKRLLRGKRPS